MLLLKLIYNVLEEHFSLAGKDPRTRHIPLVGCYRYIIILMVSYVLLSTKIGPALMKNRKPFKLKRVMQIYNIIQILLNTYIFIVLMNSYKFHPKFNWLCMNVDMTDTNPETMSITPAAYAYFLSKIVDLLDTVFFVLRKKFNQVSFLHVYHHTTMVWGVFIYNNLYFGSSFTTIGFVNSFVHMLMYTYYLISSLNIAIDLDKWKPRVTEIQIIQFIYFSIKFGLIFIYNTCGLTPFFTGMFCIQNMFMTMMFCNFYYKAYIVKRRKIKNN